MRALSAEDIIIVWERGEHRHPVDRALTMLAAAHPRMTAGELAELSIGERDARLLAIREATVGPDLQSFAECPACRERLTFTLDTRTIRVPKPDHGDDGMELVAGNHTLRFRLPNSHDLAALALCGDPETGHRLLVERCLLEATRDGIAIPGDRLPDEAVAKLAGTMAELDPQAEVLIGMECLSCGHRWQLLFDIAAFLWTEIALQAKRLLREVHILARAYGWREADILSLSATRREFYIDMVI
ncbi:MAG: phage baseplate protein [Bacteroidota bacterium]